MMEKKLQIFISSTYTDLIRERQKAVEAILEAGHIPAGMEHFHASSESQLKTIYKWIDDCDMLFLILGGRYGTIEPKSKKSYIQLEYEYAMSKGIPCCSIVLDNEFLQEKISSGNYKDVMEQKENGKYQAFKKTLLDNRLVKLVGSLNEIPLAVTSPIADYEKNPGIAGWMKGNQFNNNFSFFSNDELYRFAKDLLIEYAHRNTELDCTPELVNTMTEEMLAILEGQTYCKFFQKTITIELLDESNIRVKSSVYASYVNVDGSYNFKIYSQMNERQSLTFQVELLQIDGHDYTEEVEIRKKVMKDSNYFDYEVTSDAIYPQNPSFDISYDVSFECGILDFYQSFRIEYPCRVFTVNASIINNTGGRYKLIGSKFTNLYNNIASQEKNMPKEKYINDSICNFYFPTWSMPGTGYVLCMKKVEAAGIS